MLACVSASAFTAVALTSRADDRARADRLEQQVRSLSRAVQERPLSASLQKPVGIRAPEQVIEREALKTEAAEAPAGEPANSAQLEPEPSTEDQASYAQSVFEQQTLDPHWARETAAQLDASLTPHLGDSKLTNLECRSALCFAQIKHTNDVGYQTFLKEVLSRSHDVWKGPMALYTVHTDDTGHVFQSLYFARIGTEMPSL